ncbi:hypothetical protein NAT51_14915 [Flavobacterium amniphilum]|uniref:hypothetical protein n=1 Tax=Flavobacterium amniphilum TaxID=1834035 RepID=UPI00202A9190|nr:hypothetical protein [Flavobacterium amniphilum]MCL9806824.1 hypothetical protein [Flavobacterium amniphilum]
MESNFQTASFIEMAVVSPSQASKHNLDIIFEGEITLQDYCNALMKKIFELHQSDYPIFLNYQATLFKEPIVWLNRFEELISNNEDLFTDRRALCRYHKLFNLIESKRKEVQFSSTKESKQIAKRYINAESEDRYFSFCEVKKQIDCLDDDNEKILFLTKEKHEYRQANIEFINQKLPLFDVQCSKEIEQIYEMQSIKNTIEKFKPNVSGNSCAPIKLQFHCNVNQFVDIFYQMTCEIFVEGKPMIEGNINDIAEMIANTFVDKDGREISLQSVKTILKPSREDKRPNTNKRIDISKFL